MTVVNGWVSCSLAQQWRHFSSFSKTRIFAYISNVFQTLRTSDGAISGDGGNFSRRVGGEISTLKKRKSECVFDIVD